VGKNALPVTDSKVLTSGFAAMQPHPTYDISWRSEKVGYFVSFRQEQVILVKSFVVNTFAGPSFYILYAEHLGFVMKHALDVQLVFPSRGSTVRAVSFIDEYDSGGYNFDANTAVYIVGYWDSQATYMEALSGSKQSTSYEVSGFLRWPENVDRVEGVTTLTSTPE
jgi:hypothetical protein